MPKWEYMTIAFDHGGFRTGGKVKDMDLELNALGADGWEAVPDQPDLERTAHRLRPAK